MRLAGIPAPAPIAQGIEHRPPEAGAQVRILLGAPNRPVRETFFGSPPWTRNHGTLVAALRAHLEALAVVKEETRSSVLLPSSLVTCPTTPPRTRRCSPRSQC